MQQAIGNTTNDIIQTQLDAIKKEGNWANEQELDLDNSGDIYIGLYENGISKEELARRVLDQWNIADSKDYFADKEQIQKANSYANFLINKKSKNIQKETEEHIEEMKEAQEEAQEEKAMKMDELTNMLEDEPENAEKNAEKIVEQAKTRLAQTISRYTDKIKEMKTANDAEKENFNKEIADIKAELKKDKNNYDKTKEDYFAKSEYKIKNFSQEELGKASTKRYRFKMREGKLFNAPKITKMKTLRRNITIKKLIKKFNKIGTDEKRGVRFIMGFEKARLLRYTGIGLTSGLGKMAEGLGMDVPPKEFHAFFNAGKKNIFEILDADTGDTLEKGEKEIITALKKRINYYGYAYARERANARVNPFVEAEKTASEDEKILTPEKKEATKKVELNPPQNEKKIAA